MKNSIFVINMSATHREQVNKCGLEIDYNRFYLSGIDKVGR